MRLFLVSHFCPPPCPGMQGMLPSTTYLRNLLNWGPEVVPLWPQYWLHSRLLSFLPFYGHLLAIKSTIWEAFILSLRNGYFSRSDMISSENISRNLGQGCLVFVSFGSAPYNLYIQYQKTEVDSFSVASRDRGGRWGKSEDIFQWLEPWLKWRISTPSGRDTQPRRHWCDYGRTSGLRWVHQTIVAPPTEGKGQRRWNQHYTFSLPRLILASTFSTTAPFGGY